MNLQQALRLAFWDRAIELEGQRENRKEYSEISAITSDICEVLGLLENNDYGKIMTRLKTLELLHPKFNKIELSSLSNFIKAHVEFNLGHFSSAKKLIAKELELFDDGIDSLSTGAVLQLMRISSHIDFFMYDFEALLKTSDASSNILTPESPMIDQYLVTSISSLSHLASGEYRKALSQSKVNVDFAKKVNLQSILMPIESIFVSGAALFAMSNADDAQKTLEIGVDLAKSNNLWPWLLMIEGHQIKHLAFEKNFDAALALVRTQRALCSSITIENELSFFADLNELQVRYWLRDVDRLETLTTRLPNIRFVQQVNAAREHWRGNDLLSWIESLPEHTLRDKQYKYIHHAWYYRDSESKALSYMMKALEIAEQTGATELILREHEQFKLIVKAIRIRPTPYLEDLERRLTERVKLEQLKSKRGLDKNLTNRELEILKHLATDVPISAIGRTLNVSVNTMKTHVKNIYRKLNANTREEAIQRGKDFFII